MNRFLQILKAWSRTSPGAAIRSWWNTQPPNPWSDEEQAAVHGPDAVQICHRCLTPQKPPGWFCPKCGTATGPYNNCMPFVYIFSIGEVLRAGIDAKTRFARWVYPVYFVVGLFEYLIFAPFYWIRLFRARKLRTTTCLSIDHEN